MEGFREYIKKHKILLLHGDKYLSKYNNISVDDIYRNVSKKYEKNLRKLQEHIPAKYWNRTRWYGDWKNNIQDYDIIIIVNGIRGRDVVEFIRKYNEKARIIIYYETTIDPHDRKAPNRYQGLDCEFYSFDPLDCKKWKCHYLHYYYTYYYQMDLEAIKKEQEVVPLTKDLFFCGYDKNRIKKINDLQEKFKELSIDYKIIVVKTPHKRYWGKQSECLVDDTLNYKEIRKNIFQSRCLLEIVENGQKGITLRPMEAVFYKKKLITDNSSVKMYDFYCKENIFILGEDDINTLRGFIRSPYKDVPIEVVKKYTPEAWLDGFFCF